MLKGWKLVGEYNNNIGGRVKVIFNNKLGLSIHVSDVSDVYGKEMYVITPICSSVTVGSSGATTFDEAIEEGMALARKYAERHPWSPVAERVASWDK